MIYYEEVFEALNLDIFAKLTQDNLMRLGKATGKLGYRPKLPVKVNDFALVDVFVEEIIKFDEAKS